MSQRVIAIGDIHGCLDLLVEAHGKIDGVGELKTCPLPMITPFSSFLSSLSQHYRDGHLLETGGILDQPNIYLESMRIFGGA